MIFSKLRDSPSGFWSLATSLGVLVGGATLYYAYQKYARTKLLPTEWEEVGTVSRLFIHPIKSAKPVAISKATATAEGLSDGLLMDRSFIVFTEQGDMVTGRDKPMLTTLSTSFDGRCLTVTSNEGDHVSLDIEALNQKKRIKKFSLRNSVVQGIDCGDEVAEWLTKHICKGSMTKVRLVYRSGVNWKREKKKIDYYSFPNFGRKDSTLFNDCTSYMINTEATLTDLNTRLETPVDFSFSRPCIVIEGSQPFDEDYWTYIKLGQTVVLHEAKPRELCLLPQIDPRNGSKRTEPFDVLKSYRTVSYPETLAKAWKGKPIFGVHCGIDVIGNIKVGDKVYVHRGRSYWVASNRNSA